MYPIKFGTNIKTDEVMSRYLLLTKVLTLVTTEIPDEPREAGAREVLRDFDERLTGAITTWRNETERVFLTKNIFPTKPLTNKLSIVVGIQQDDGLIPFFDDYQFFHQLH